MCGQSAGSGALATSASAASRWTRSRPVRAASSTNAARKRGPSCHQWPNSSVSNVSTQSPPSRTRSAQRAAKVGGVGTRLSARALVVVDGAVVGPRMVVVGRAVVVVAVGRGGRVAARRPRRGRSARGRAARAAGPAGLRSGVRWRAVAQPEDVGELDAGRVDAGLLEQRVEPGVVRALRQPEAAAPSRRRSARDGRRCPRAAAGGRRRRSRSAAGSRGSRCSSTRRARRRRPSRSQVDRLEPRERDGVLGGRALELVGEVVAAGRTRARRCRARCEALRTSRRKAAQRSIAPGASSWSQSDGRQRQRQRRAGVEQVEQRQVARRDGLPQPLLAERPGAEALDVGHVGVQDEGDAAGAAAHGVQDRHEVERAVEVGVAPAATSAKSRSEIAGVKRS